MSDIISLRSDDEIRAALTDLGVTPDERNRTQIIKAAILAYRDDLHRELGLSIDTESRRQRIDAAIKLLQGLR